MKTPPQFVILTGQLLQYKELTIGTKLVYGLISGLCRLKGYCWASNETMATYLDIDIRSVKRATQSLEELGFIVKKPESSTGRRIFITKKAIKQFGTFKHSDDFEKMGDNLSKMGDNLSPNNITIINSSFPKEKEEAPAPHKRGKKVKFPGAYIFDIAQEKWPDTITKEAIKIYKSDFIEYFTEGDGSIVAHVNWPLTFKKWVERDKNWNKRILADKPTGRVVRNQLDDDCPFCKMADKLKKPCHIHKGRNNAKSKPQNIHLES